MLNVWISTEQNLPASWLKITGRYIVQNIAAILAECARIPPECRMVIDQIGRARLARTQLFWVQTDFFRSHLSGLYQQCNDATGDWIERVLFRSLGQMDASSAKSFGTQPRLSGTWGSTGRRMNPGFFPFFVKACLRRINRLFDARYLWYPRG